MKLVLSSAVLAGVLLITGCGGTQCESICTQYNACTVAERSINVDCVDFCSSVDALNARAAAESVSCAQLWTAHLNCWQQNVSNICDSSFADCDDEAAAWGGGIDTNGNPTGCIDAYCDAKVAANEFDKACQGAFEGFNTNLSLISPFQSGF